MLSDAQQERYARHLLVAELGGEGQERLLDGVVGVRLPGPAAAVALWAVRYLAASGIGTLVLQGPWAEEASQECARFWPGVRVHAGAQATAADAVWVVGEGTSAEDGAPGQSGRSVSLAWGAQLPVGEAAALGARAALEAVKRIAGAGRPAPLPLRTEAAP